MLIIYDFGVNFEHDTFSFPLHMLMLLILLIIYIYIAYGPRCHQQVLVIVLLMDLDM